MAWWTLCEDLGEAVSIVLELDATAAKGILDMTGWPKARHIYDNCFWLQEQCTKTLVPLFKGPGDRQCAGEDATARAAREKALADVVSALFADVVELRADNSALRRDLDGLRTGAFWQVAHVSGLDIVVSDLRARCEALESEVTVVHELRTRCEELELDVEYRAPPPVDSPPPPVVTSARGSVDI